MLSSGPYAKLYSQFLFFIKLNPSSHSAFLIYLFIDDLRKVLMILKQMAIQIDSSAILFKSHFEVKDQ